MIAACSYSRFVHVLGINSLNFDRFYKQQDFIFDSILYFAFVSWCKNL